MTQFPLRMTHPLIIQTLCLVFAVHLKNATNSLNNLLFIREAKTQKLIAVQIPEIVKHIVWQYQLWSFQGRDTEGYKIEKDFS